MNEIKNKCMLKIATYNIWNDDLGQEKRAEQLLYEIHNIQVDIIGLQEVTENFYQKYLSTDSAFTYSYFVKYPGDTEGLAFLSRYPFEEVFFLQNSEDYVNSRALNVIIRINNVRISITNLHLPWDSAKKQEEQIVAIDHYIHTQNKKVDFFVLLGDFNGNMNSSVNRFLLGDQTINGNESNLYWNDLQSSYCVRNGVSLTATLDFINNPRWKGKETLSVPMVADRIYVMESWDDIAMKQLCIFGTNVFRETGMCASDHYGIATELEFGI